MASWKTQSSVKELKSKNGPIIPDEVLNRKVRLPKFSSQPVYKDVSKLFENEVDDISCYEVMAKIFIDFDLSETTIDNALKYIVEKSLETSVNSIPICKYLYLVSKSEKPNALLILQMFYKHLEQCFLKHKSLEAECLTNFAIFFMASVHHCRSVIIPPIPELVHSLLALADNFKTDLIQGSINEKNLELFCLMIIRSCNYIKMLQLNNKCDPELIDSCNLLKNIARESLIKHDHTKESKSWLMLAIDGSFNDALTVYEKYCDLSCLNDSVLTINIPRSGQKYFDPKVIPNIKIV